MKETYGSQETLYHSCWSLADCGSGDNGKEDSEDTKSLNESLLPSNSGPGMPELGLKWPSGFGGNLGGNIWGRIPSEGTLDKVQWRQIQSNLSMHLISICNMNTNNCTIDTSLDPGKLFTDL